MKSPDFPSLDMLKQLAAFESDMCLTLSMPCVVAGDQQPQNSIRYKNLLQEARGKLSGAGWNGDDIADFLEPAINLMNAEHFDRYQREGLLVCLAKNFFAFYQLPFPVEPSVVTGRHFYLREVIPRLARETDIALLLLNAGEPRIVVSHAGAAKPEIFHPPQPYHSFEAFMEIFDLEESLQFRSQGYAGGMRRTQAGFHGQGGANDDARRKVYLHEYFKQIENWAAPMLAKLRDARVFLVADPATQGVYLSIMRSSHPRPRILAQKNPDSDTIESWTAQAAALLEEDWQRDIEETLGLYHRLKNTDGRPVLEDLPDIAEAARQRRVDIFLLPENAAQNGTQREIGGKADEDINTAVRETFLNDGRIVPVPEERSTGYAALCRW